MTNRSTDTDPVLVHLVINEPGLPHDHDKTIEIDPEVWGQLDTEGRIEYIEARGAEFAAEIYELFWEISSDHDIDAPGAGE
jgi:hypothetical protein